MKRVVVSFVSALTVVLMAGSASAQEAGGGYISALGGFTFGGDTKTSPLIGAEGGYAITNELTAYGQLGLSLNMLDKGPLEDQCPRCDIDASVRLTFLTGGVKYAFPLSGSAFRPYVAGGVGFGRVSLKVEVDDVDIEDDSSTEGLFEFGGGVEIPMGTSHKIDVGYRAMKIFEDDTDVLHRVYAAFGWIF